MKPIVAMLGESIFMTTLATSLQSRVELVVKQIGFDNSTALNELQALKPHALLLDPVVRCPKLRQDLLSAFEAQLTQPLIHFEFCDNNMKLNWKIISCLGVIEPEHESEPVLHDVVCMESLVQVVLESCRALEHLQL